jgi:hypothetical protein
MTSDQLDIERLRRWEGSRKACRQVMLRSCEDCRSPEAQYTIHGILSGALRQGFLHAFLRDVADDDTDGPLYKSRSQLRGRLSHYAVGSCILSIAYHRSNDSAHSRPAPRFIAIGPTPRHRGVMSLMSRGHFGEQRTRYARGVRILFSGGPETT